MGYNEQVDKTAAQCTVGLIDFQHFWLLFYLCTFFGPLLPQKQETTLIEDYCDSEEVSNVVDLFDLMFSVCRI